MRIIVRAAIVAATLAVGATAGSAFAQERAVRAAHDAIQGGDFAAAEQTLLAEQRIYPDNAEVMLNLAAVYSRTGRAQLAAPLYLRVLAQRDVLMDLDAERTASAHTLAQTGLQRIGYTQTAAR